MKKERKILTDNVVGREKKMEMDKINKTRLIKIKEERRRKLRLIIYMFKQENKWEMMNELWNELKNYESYEIIKAKLYILFKYKRWK